MSDQVTKKQNPIVRVLVKIGDFFLDKSNSGDEKRAMGILYLIFAVVYISSIRPGDATGFGAISGVGLLLLGVAAWADKIGLPPGGGGMN